MSDPELAMKRGQNCTDGAKRQIFRFNPGKSMRIFPDRHPYYKVPNNAKKEIDKRIIIEGRKRALEFMPTEEKHINLGNISTGKLNQGNKPRHRLLYHCFNIEELDAAVFFWNNPQSLNSPRISILGENKDMNKYEDKKILRRRKREGFVNISNIMAFIKVSIG